MSEEQMSDAERLEAKRVALLDKLRRGHANLIVSTIPKRSPETPVPLSYPQQRMLFMEQIEPGTSAYQLAWCVRLQGSLNVEALEHALSGIGERHDALRTVYDFSGDLPRPIVRPNARLAIETIDLQALPSETQLNAAIDQARREAERPFDLHNGPLYRATLYRLTATDHVLLLIAHHSIVDGWSLGILVTELVALYNYAVKSNSSAILPELTIDYSDFACWQRAETRTVDLSRQMDYWERQLAAPLPVLELPADRSRPAVRTHQGSTFRFNIRRCTADQLRELSRAEGVTLYMTLLTALQTLLHRYTGLTDIVVGSPVANRNVPEVMNVIGMFVNFLVLRTDFDGNPTFRSALRRVRKVALEAYANQDVPFEQLVEILHPERDPSHTPIFQVSFTFQNSPSATLRLSGLSVSNIPIDRQTSKFDLTLFVEDVNGELTSSFEYSTELFELATVSRLAQSFITLLQSALDDPDRAVADLELLSEGERSQLLIEWQKTDVPYPDKKCLHDLVEEQCNRTPEAVALETNESRITYADLSRLSGRLAYRLQELGVKPEELVAVCLERSVDMVIALLGVLKAGGAYLPIDPEYPRERVAFILEDSRPAVTVTRQSLAEKLCLNGKIVCMDSEPDLWNTTHIAKPASTGPDNLAYVIYTSGSTGKPKGAMNTHRAICNRLHWMQDRYRISSDDAVLQKTPSSFDVSVWEFFWPLISGARVVLAEPGRHRDPAYIVEEIRRHNVTTIHFVPSLLRAFLESPAVQTCGTLRRVISSGEALSTDLVQLFFETLGSSTELHNLYGPTEAAIDVTHWSCRADERNPRVPIGRPISNISIYVLDNRLRPVPIGVPGELFIGGIGVGRGYWRRPGLTAEKFGPDPFSDRSGSRLYRTGDLARVLSDGNIEFLGRRDNQIKLRGLRIELEEIESALLQHEQISGAAVIAGKIASIPLTGSSSPADPKGPTVRDMRPFVKRSANDERQRAAETQLTAYVVPMFLSATEASKPREAMALQQVAAWTSVFDEVYARELDETDPAFQIAGWSSSITAHPIPRVEMREWLDETVTSVLALKPRRILELGCGTGLLLFRLAQHCERYCGIDPANAAIEHVRSNLHILGDAAQNVSLYQANAIDIERVRGERFDCVILNSVVQYFPSIDYLVGVLNEAVSVLEKDGTIFLGDVRDLRLLRAFHTSIELDKSADDDTAAGICRRVESRILAESELLIDPVLFGSIPEIVPGVTSIQLSLKRGAFLNELTRFRFQAVLRVGLPGESFPEEQWINWESDRMSLAWVEQALKEEQHARLALRGMLNARLVRAVRAIELLRVSPQVPIGALRGQLDDQKSEEIDPAMMWRIAEKAGYSAEVFPALSGPDRFGVIFSKRNGLGKAGSSELMTTTPSVVDLHRYANDPMKGKLVRELPARLREHLRRILPEYMIPASFVVVDALPLGPSGKIDRSALPQLRGGVSRSEEAYVAPSTRDEKIIAEIFSKVLGVDRPGVSDNFFDLGGDSIRAIQVRALALDEGLALSLADLFRNKSIRELANTCGGVSELSRVLTEPYSQVSEEDRRCLPDDVQDAYPLARVQAGMIFHIESEPELNLYQDTFFYRMRASFHLAHFTTAIRALERRHPILRTSIDLSTYSEPLQLVHKQAVAQIEVLDLRGLRPEDQDSRQRSWTSAERARGFNLSTAPLIRYFFHRLLDDVFDVVVSSSNLILDGWSTASMLTELWTYYATLIKDQPIEISRSPRVTYRDFVASEREAIRSKAHALYWKDALSGWESTGLATNQILPISSNEPPIGFVDVPLSSRVKEGLKQLARLTQTSLKHVLLAAHMKTLSMLSGKRCVVTGFECNGRLEDYDGDKTLGIHTNTVPLIVELRPGTWFDLIRLCFETENAVLPFRRYPLAELQRGRSEPLFEWVFNYTHFHVFKEVLKQHGEVIGGRGYGMSQWPLRVEFNRDPFSGLPNLDFEYDRRSMPELRIHEITRCFQETLGAMIANPYGRHEAQRVLSVADEDRILRKWNDTAGSYPANKQVYHLVSAHFETSRNAPAIVCGRHTVSYGSLGASVAGLYERLMEEGVGPEDRVAIVAGGCPEAIAAILATLATGAAYVPIDSSYPNDRIQYLLDDCRPRAIVAQNAVARNLKGLGKPCIALGQTLSDSGTQILLPRGVPVRPENAAYVIYTSGSTGRPKGVVGSHKNLLSSTWARKEYYRSPVGSLLLTAPIGSDSSLAQIFWSLVTGGTLVLPEDTRRIDIDELVTLITTHRISHLLCVPTLYRLLLEHVRGAELKSLRQVIVAGESCTSELVQKHRMVAPDVPLYNEYGPAECSIWSTVYECVTMKNTASVPIGGPIANRRVYILDEFGQPVPDGVTGEIYLGGEGVARGYLACPTLTAERFLPDPFGEPGQRIYRTGDLARRDSDGVLEFAGRRDEQVKINGHRVELGEIEAVLRQHSSIADAAVVAHAARIVAFLEARKVDGSAPTSPRELRKYLANLIPPYMIPHSFLFVEMIPRNVNGKVDRSALVKALLDDKKGLLATVKKISEMPDETVRAILNDGNRGESKLPIGSTLASETPILRFPR